MSINPFIYFWQKNEVSSTEKSKVLKNNEEGKGNYNKDKITRIIIWIIIETFFSTDNSEIKSEPSGHSTPMKNAKTTENELDDSG